MRIVLIGAGRVATQMGRALQQAGHTIVCVYSRSETSAERLATLLHCPYTINTDEIAAAEAVIFMVSDSALEDVATKVCPHFDRNTLFIHTAGSMPMGVFRGKATRYGVLYPMQTFSIERDIDFKQVPCFVEGSDQQSLNDIKKLASSISQKVRELSYIGRRHLHLAAVFASNMANHCYHIAERICSKNGIAFSDMLPLIEETALKICTMSPHDAQTGPAVRHDHNVMQAQVRLLDDYPETQRLYQLMSNNIERMHNDDKL